MLALSHLAPREEITPPYIGRWNTVHRPVGLLTARRMLSLTAVVPLLCLALSWVQAQKLCGHNRRCVPHHLCEIGFEEEEPGVDFRNLQTGNQGCPSTEKCCPVDKVLQEKDQIKPWLNLPEEPKCGQINKKGRSFAMRSASGLAQENEVPWTTALLHTNGTYLGGGSLVAPDVVLTAHHIVARFDSHEIVVRAGEWDFNTDTEKFPHLEVGVRMIVCHPSFNRRTGGDNLALLFLKKPFELSRHIQPICLPSRNQNFDRKRCFVSGWGKDAVTQKSFMNIMKKVELPVVSQRTCEAQMKIHKGPAFRLHGSLMCAGGEEGKDACVGDGGSPLACPLENDPDRFEQAGIVNWGVGCGSADTPGVYTDVAKFRSWIDEHITRHSLTNGEFKPVEDESTSDIEDKEWNYQTTPPNRPQITNRRTEKPPTRSPNEIDPDDYFKVTTTMRYDDHQPIPMVILKSR